MPYYRVNARIIEDIEEYVEAKSKKKAIEKVQEIEGSFIEDIDVEKISKEEYEDYKL